MPEVLDATYRITTAAFPTAPTVRSLSLGRISTSTDHAAWRADATRKKMPKMTHSRKCSGHTAAWIRAEAAPSRESATIGGVGRAGRRTLSRHHSATLMPANTAIAAPATNPKCQIG